MENLRTTGRLAIGAFLITAVAWGQTGWDRLQSIAPGQKIRVYTTNNRVEGAYVRASPEAIDFKLEDGQHISISQIDVTRIEARSESHRGRNTLIGAAIGVGLGVAAYASYGRLLRNEGAKSTEAIILAPAVSGAGIGAILPSARFKRIYDVKQAR